MTSSQGMTLRQDRKEGFACGKGVHLGQSSDVKEQVPGREFQKVLWGCGSGKGVRQECGPRQGQLWQALQ